MAQITETTIRPYAEVTGGQVEGAGFLEYQADIEICNARFFLTAVQVNQLADTLRANGGRHCKVSLSVWLDDDGRMFFGRPDEMYAPIVKQPAPTSRIGWAG